MPAPLRISHLVVEAWAPDYGASVADELDDTTARVTCDAELAPADWRPLGQPDGAVPHRVGVIDGVQRTDANVWVVVEAASGAQQLPVQALCASVAAGLAICEPGLAHIADVQVRRYAVSHEALPSIETSHGAWATKQPTSVKQQLEAVAHQAMTDLERLVVAQAVEAGVVFDLLILDGPIRTLGMPSHTVGSIKTHSRAYLPDELQRVLAALAPAERTPMFRIEQQDDPQRTRWSAYLRLGRRVAHGWDGIVRLEIPGELAIVEAVETANRAQLALPGLASEPFKDARAPQNLVPIGALETVLRHRLGDATLCLRALQSAAR